MKNQMSRCEKRPSGLTLIRNPRLKNFWLVKITMYFNLVYYYINCKELQFHSVQFLKHTQRRWKISSCIYVNGIFNIFFKINYTTPVNMKIVLPTVSLNLFLLFSFLFTTFFLFAFFLNSKYNKTVKIILTNAKNIFSLCPNSWMW